MSDRPYGDDVAAYVACYVWVADRDLAMADQLRAEMLDQGSIGRAEWNAACQGTAAYSRRRASDAVAAGRASDTDADKFLAAQVAEEELA